ncbi:UNVERIFIED_CONTAM: putative RNA-binding protein Luc7-like 1 [Sesamum indicum]
MVYPWLYNRKAGNGLVTVSIISTMIRENPSHADQALSDFHMTILASQFNQSTTLPNPLKLHKGPTSPADEIRLHFVHSPILGVGEGEGLPLGGQAYVGDAYFRDRRIMAFVTQEELERMISTYLVKVTPPATKGDAEAEIGEKKVKAIRKATDQPRLDFPNTKEGQWYLEAYWANHLLEFKKSMDFQRDVVKIAEPFLEYDFMAYKDGERYRIGEGEAMDALRKQLDVLMGANRNGDAQEVTRKYYDRDVCRLFLAGLCPHELFQLTKMDKGPCPKVHSLQLRKEYEEAKAKGLDNYDRDLEDNIDRLIVECDRKIARALKRLDEEDAKAAIAISVSEVTQTLENIELSKQIKEKLKEADQFDLEGKTDMKIRALEEVEDLRTKRADKQAMLLLDAFNKDRASLPQPLTNNTQLAPLPAALPDPHIQDMINEKLKKAEDLGEQGMVDEAQKALEEAEALKKLPPRQEAATDSSKYTAADVRITDQKLRVCDICGAFLSVYDSDRRLADHFGGKLHLGYMLIREKLAELQQLVILLVINDHQYLQYLSWCSEYFGSVEESFSGYFKCWIVDENACSSTTYLRFEETERYEFGASEILSVALNWINECGMCCHMVEEERDKKRKTHEEDRRNDKFLVLFRSRDRKSRDGDRESSKDHDKSETRERGRDYDHRGRDRDRHYDRHRGYDREPMTQGVAGDLVPDLKNAREIMIATGSISKALLSLCCFCLPLDVDVVWE